MSDLRHAPGEPGTEAAPVAEELARITAMVPPVVREAQEAFRLALPQLLHDRAGQWVAYHGARQLGFAPTKTELYQRCREQGYPRGEFIVRLIRPQPGEEVFVGPFELG